MTAGRRTIQRLALLAGVGTLVPAACGQAGSGLAPRALGVQSYAMHAPERPKATPTGAMIYVADHGSFGQSNNPAVTLYQASASGSPTPVARLAGRSTKEDQIQYVAVDSTGVLYVSNQNSGTSSGSVTEYRGLLNGNFPPFNTLTNLRTPEGVAVDSSNNLYVATIDSLLVFAPKARGHAKPIRDITGSNTLILNPYQVFVDASGKQYLAEQNAVYTFAPGADGNVAPLQNIQGSATMLQDVLGVAADSIGQIYATNLNANNVVVFSATATGNATPSLVVTSSAFNEPWGIYIDASDTVYVANRGNDTIAIFSKAAFPTGIPTAVIAGKKTLLDNPIGIAVR